MNKKTGYQSACELETTHMPSVMKFLKSNKDIVSIEKIVDKELQYRYGDLIVTMVDGSIYNVEVKVDSRTLETGNLYLEYWSNDSVYPKKEGWMQYCQADFILYYPIGEYNTEKECDNKIIKQTYNKILKIDFKKLKHWFFDEKNINRYETKGQYKYDQKNTPLGYLVPTVDLEDKNWVWVEKHIIEEKTTTK